MSDVERAVLEHLLDLVVVLDGDARITWSNRAAHRILGRHAEEVIGTSALDYVHPDDLELAAAEIIEAVLDEGPKDPIRLRLLHADGHEVPIEAYGGRIESPLGEIVVSLRDVGGRDASTHTFDVLDRRYRALADAGLDAIVTVSRDGLLLSWNAGAGRMLGHQSADVIGRPVTDVLPSGLDADDGVLEATALHRDGHAVAVELSVSAYEEAGIEYRVAILRDISARKAAEAAARAASQLFRSAFDAAPIGMAVVGLDGTFLQVNSALCDIVGYDADELVQLRFQDITHADDLDADLELVRRLATGGIPGYRMEKRYFRADGDLVWVQLSVSLVRDGEGRPAHFLSQIEDITERRAQTDGLAYQAHHDEVTGLLNRHAILRRFEQALARRHLARVTALFMDLDGFKDVNDTHGHTVGDEVLRVVAGRVVGALRPNDAVARFGGDEFVGLCEGVDELGAVMIADRLTRSIAEPIVLADGSWVQVTASVGFAVAGLDDTDAEALLARADAAMYDVKRVRTVSR